VDDAGGGNYQALIKDALRMFVAAQDRSLEQIPGTYRGRSFIGLDQIETVGSW